MVILRLFSTCEMRLILPALASLTTCVIVADAVSSPALANANQINIRATSRPSQITPGRYRRKLIIRE